MGSVNYAVDCILSGLSETKKIKEVCPGQRTRYINMLCNSYSYGFVAGIKEMFNRQQKEEGWGLVLTLSEAVKKEVESMKAGNYYSKKSEDLEYGEYDRGVSDGQTFTPARRLSAN